MFTESEKESIQKETREILSRFGAALDRIPTSRLQTHVEGVLRVEEAGCVCDPSFRQGMFANAPHKTADSIVAEKASW